MIYLKCHPEPACRQAGLIQDLLFMSSKTYFIYIITNFTNTTLYIGITNNLERRIFEHKHELLNGFSKQYHLKKLIYFEEYNDIQEALTREKQLKNWKRTWKIDLITKKNPTYKDLFADAESSSA